MSDEFDQLYREVILDHYKNPRSHGLLDAPDAHAEGQNPLCGDEVAVSLRFDGDTISEVGFEGRGCAISQAATSMLTELVQGRSADEVARMDKEELLEEIGIPLTPVRLKCAILGLGVLKVALHKAKGTPLPEEWSGSRRSHDRVARDVDVCPVEELPPGHVKIVYAGLDRRSASTTAPAPTTRSRTAARTTTARSARGSGSPRCASRSAPATARASTSRPGAR